MRELRIALIGGGFMGRAHSLAYGIADVAADLGARLRRQVLVEATPELAADAARQLGWRESSGSWEEVVVRPDIEIVDICTPPDLHAPIAVAALAAGKHVFCEKPIANNVDDAELIRDAAARSAAATQIGFNYRHTPAISFAKQLLDDGKLGAPLLFRGSYLQDSAFNADPNRWRATRDTGGSGMVADIGSHVIDVAELMFGDIARVSALVRAKGVADGAGWVSEDTRLHDDVLDDAGVWIAEFANAALGSFTINAYASGRKNELSFAFDATRGAVDFNWNRREEFRVSYVDEPSDHLGMRTIHTNDQHPDGWWRLAGLGTGYIEVMAVQLQHFIRAIVEGRSSSPDFATGARVQQIVQAVRASAATGEWVGTPRQPASLMAR